MPIPFEVRLDYATNVTRLSLWYAQQQPLPLKDTITKITPIYRLTNLWDGKRHPADGHRDESWEQLLDKLGHAPPSKFEDYGLALFGDLIADQAKKDAQQYPFLYGAAGITEKDLFGPFWYSTQGENIILHFVNISAPISPFADMEQLRHDFSRLVWDAIAKYPNTKTVQGLSWLNQTSALQKLFPPEWIGRAVPTETVTYHNNWWGQFINQEGGYHHANGNSLRRTGQFPYSSVQSTCSIEALYRHLS